MCNLLHPDTTSSRVEKSEKGWRLPAEAFAPPVGDGTVAALSVSHGWDWQSSRAVLIVLQEEAAGRKGAVKAGGQACDVCGDVGENSWCGLVVVGDLKENAPGQMRRGKPLHLNVLACFLNLCRSPSANLGDGSGLFQDCEAGTEHLSPGIVFSGRVSWQSDRAQSYQVRIPERRQNRRASSSGYEELNVEWHEECGNFVMRCNTWHHTASS